MPAYAIFIRENTRDQSSMDTYMQEAPGGSAAFGARPLAFYGRSETVEGPKAEAVVLVEFPTLEDAQAWYNSDHYQNAKRHRHLGADYRAILFEGLPPPA